jgi:hypothetical protein
MRKLFTGVLGLSLAATLIYGAIGSGANFAFTGAADQQIQVGTIGYTLSTDTGTVSGNTVTCNALVVMTSSNWAGYPVGDCHVTIVTTGNIVPTISVFGKATGTFPTADLGSFRLDASKSGLAWLTGGGQMLLSKPIVDPTWGFDVGMVASPPTNTTFTFAYDWGQYANTPELGNGDMGTFIQMVYTFSASA